MGCRITVSSPPDTAATLLALLDTLTEPWAGGIEFVEETDAALAAVVLARGTDRIRYAAPDRVPEDVLRARLIAIREEAKWRLECGDGIEPNERQAIAKLVQADPEATMAEIRAIRTTPARDRRNFNWNKWEGDGED